MKIIRSSRLVLMRFDSKLCIFLPYFLSFTDHIVCGQIIEIVRNLLRANPQNNFISIFVKKYLPRTHLQCCSSLGIRGLHQRQTKWFDRFRFCSLEDTLRFLVSQELNSLIIRYAADIGGMQCNNDDDMRNRMMRCDCTWIMLPWLANMPLYKCEIKTIYMTTL